MTDEQVVKDMLSKWFIENNIDVYWEEDRGYGYPVFKTKWGDKGNKIHPDLLIFGEKRNVVIEVKEADSKSNIYDGIEQCYKYWCDYHDGNKYYVDREEIPITDFVLATENFINGYLYPEQYEIKLLYSEFGEERQKAITRGELPVVEYSMTEQTTRVLWRLANRKNYNTHVGIGTLVSTCLVADPRNKPMIFVKWGGNQKWMIP